MEVYIEYALIENFCVDFAILYLTARFCKIPFPRKRACLSAGIGATFAVVYPFLSLFHGGLASVLKAVFPILFVYLAFGGFKKNGVGRYALSVGAFYVVSFAFAGSIFGICAVFGAPYAYGDGLLTQAPIGLILSGLVFVGTVLSKFQKGVYRRKMQTKFLYPCEIFYQGRRVKTVGFVDSGNVARKDGTPICFLSAELFFELFQEESFTLLMEEVAVTSLAGEKKIKIAKVDEIRIYFGGKTNIIKNPYCSRGYAFGTREYKLLLGSWATEGMDE